MTWKPGWYAWWPLPSGGSVEFVELFPDGRGYRVATDEVIPADVIATGRIGIRLRTTLTGIPLDGAGRPQHDAPLELGW